jgi:heat shock protein HtpX
MIKKSILPEEQIQKNKRDTLIICLLMLLLFFGIIFSIGFILGVPPIFATTLGFILALGYITVTYSFSVQSILSASKARPANPQKREEKIFIYKVEEMAIAAGLPTPKAYVQDSTDINAFATGKKPENAIICVTTGALQKLNKEEIEGIISHEMSHIKNHDILVATVTIGIVGTIALLAEITLRSLFWGGRGRGKKGGHIIILILALLFIILAPLFSRLTYLAISRRREYLADANGAYLTRNPQGLARALEKIRLDLPDDPKGSQTVAPLYIANPFKRSRRDSLWSTHPPLEKRITRLKSM